MGEQFFFLAHMQSVPMIIRIVKMEFRPEELERFQLLFDRQKHRIRAFPGCLLLELHKDPVQEQVRYTFSHWESAQALENYRKSELFRSIWPQTKQLFAAPPLACSLEKLEEVQDFQDF